MDHFFASSSYKLLQWFGFFGPPATYLVWVIIVLTDICHTTDLNPLMFIDFPYSTASYSTAQQHAVDKLTTEQCFLLNCDIDLLS